MLKAVSKPTLSRPILSSTLLRNSSYRGVRGTSEGTVSDHSSSSLHSHTATDPLAPSRTSGYSAFDLVKELLTRWTETTAVAIRNRADDFTTRTQSTFSKLGSHMNRATGYEEIEALKKQVVEQESRINLTRQTARAAKTAYDAAVSQRSNSQREINDLLQRKSLWTDADLIRFTTLVRLDHTYEQDETRAKASVDETEAAVETEFSELLRCILARYHEEQVWSDKIRSASTYGSLAALGLNLVVFIMAIVVVEPWKRRRLARTFEKKIEEMGTENQAVVENGLRELGNHLAEQRTLLSDGLEAASRVMQAMERVEASREQLEPAFPMARVPKTEQIVVMGAVIAGVVGWFARNWFGT